MLVLTRRMGEVVWVGENVKLTMVKVRGGQVRIAIDAPTSVPIRRGELAALRGDAPSLPRPDRPLNGHPKSVRPRRA